MREPERLGSAVKVDLSKPGSVTLSPSFIQNTTVPNPNRILVFPPLRPPREHVGDWGQLTEGISNYRKRIANDRVSWTQLPSGGYYSLKPPSVPKNPHPSDPDNEK